MSFIRVIIDWTKRSGCPECYTYRADMYKNPDYRHWQICKEHRKCVELQHLAHQPEDIEPEMLEDSADAHSRRLIYIETNDGSLERELNTFAEDKYEVKERGLDPEYCPEAPSRHVVSKIGTSEQNKIILSLLSHSEGPRSTEAT